MNNNFCPFCEENIKEITFLESDNFRVIYNIAPAFPGHSLLISKKHIQSLLDFNDVELLDLMKTTQKAVNLLQKAFNTKAFNFSLQEKEEAGQSIPHIHFHIIPRVKNDLEDAGLWYQKIENNYSEILDNRERPKLSRQQLIEIANYLRTFAEKHNAK